MDPRPKRTSLKEGPPLPLITKKDGSLYKFRGVFNGFSVVVDKEEDMKNLISMGYFGKATLSRNYPQFGQNRPEIIRNRVFATRKKFQQPSNPPQKVIVVPDSNDDQSHPSSYFTNLQPKYELDRSGLREVVNLGLEEAFFLVAAVNCLDIYSEDQKLTPEAMWDIFRRSDRNFTQNYIVYYYYRAKKWVVKPGIKFGGDFLLYKQGPPFYHASYVVIIDVLDHDMTRNDHLTRRSMNIVNLMALNRLCETAGKELLICQVICPLGLSLDKVQPGDLSTFTVKEITMKRWRPSDPDN